VKYTLLLAIGVGSLLAACDIAQPSTVHQAETQSADLHRSDDSWQYPIRLADTRAQVHTLLGAATRSDSILEEYPASGVSLWFDQNDRVTKLNFIGEAGGAYRSALEGMLSDQPLLFGLTARSDEAAFRKVFGQPRQEQIEGPAGRRERHLVWKKYGYVIDGLFFVEVHKTLTCKDPCDVSTEAYRPGTLVWFDVYRGL
jgi:hypothetical protein